MVTTNTSSPLFGCLNTGYDVGGGFESDDRGTNPGYKPDENVMIARYMLQTWALFEQDGGTNAVNESTNAAIWYQTAVNAVNWALAQRNPDGGLPQLLNLTTLTPSPSVASGRTMAALPVIASITGNTNYLATAQSLEGFVTNQWKAATGSPDSIPISLGGLSNRTASGGFANIGWTGMPAPVIPIICNGPKPTAGWGS